MNVLILGGNGFIGRRAAAILRERGHEVVAAGRKDCDYLRLDEAAVRALLRGKDVVVNAVGVMSRHADILEQVHHRAPEQLAQWAEQEGVSRWVQLSALGADAQSGIAFVGSKGRGDRAVYASGVQVSIARPSVVYGRGGVSCELFITLAKLPLLAMPAGGRFDLQPVHVADVAEGLANLAENPAEHGTVVNMTGGRALTLADYFNALRQTLHKKPPQKMIALPLSWIKPLLPLANVVSNGVLSPSSIALLEQGSCADNGAFASLLGREPLKPEDFAGMV